MGGIGLNKHPPKHTHTHSECCQNTQARHKMVAAGCGGGSSQSLLCNQGPPHLFRHMKRPFDSIKPGGSAIDNSTSGWCTHSKDLRLHPTAKPPNARGQKPETQASKEHHQELPSIRKGLPERAASTLFARLLFESRAICVICGRGRTARLIHPA